MPALAAAVSSGFIRSLESRQARRRSGHLPIVLGRHVEDLHALRALGPIGARRRRDRDRGTSPTTPANPSPPAYYSSCSRRRRREDPRASSPSSAERPALYGGRRPGVACRHGRAPLPSFRLSWRDSGQAKHVLAAMVSPQLPLAALSGTLAASQLLSGPWSFARSSSRSWAQGITPHP